MKIFTTSMKADTMSAIPVKVREREILLEDMTRGIPREILREM